MFKVGQKVVCIKARIKYEPYLEKGGVYEIIALLACPKCNHLSIGVYLSDKVYRNHICSCGNHIPYTGVPLASWTHFAITEEKSNITIEEVLEQIYLGEPIGNHMS